MEIEGWRMEDRNCELLFEYLRSILYDSKVKPLDVEGLDEPFQKLGLGLQYLDKAVQEMKQCSAALSKGDLSSFNPARENFLCENLKNIHANLNHLTWQAKQVAKGDYSQMVSYLGEFSEAFNTMTEQLRERENSLKLIAEKEKKHAEMAESYNFNSQPHEEADSNFRQKYIYLKLFFTLIAHTNLVFLFKLLYCKFFSGKIHTFSGANVLKYFCKLTFRTIILKYL